MNLDKTGNSKRDIPEFVRDHVIIDSSGERVLVLTHKDTIRIVADRDFCKTWIKAIQECRHYADMIMIHGRMGELPLSIRNYVYTDNISKVYAFVSVLELIKDIVEFDPYKPMIVIRRLRD